MPTHKTHNFTSFKYDIFEVRLQSSKRDIKPSTIASYAFAMMRFIRSKYPTWKKEEPYFEKLRELVKTDGYVENFLTSVGDATANSILAVIIVGLSPDGRYLWRDGMKDYGQKLNELLKDRKDKYYNKIAKQILTPNQKLKWTDWETLMAIHKKYKRKIKWFKMGKSIYGDSVKCVNQAELLQMYLVASLYLIMPPRRLEYAGMKVILKKDWEKKPNGEKANYLVWDGNPRGYSKKKFFIFGDYKTVKKYGIQRINITRELNTVINMWLSARTASSSEYLLVNKNGKKMTPNGLSKFIQKTFRESGKEVSATMLRHIYVSNIFKDDTTQVEKEFLARAMGHSVATQQITYVKH